MRLVAWGLAVGLLAGPALGGGAVVAAGWKAGAAKVAITPKQPMWMAGYGARMKPSEGAMHDLWAKALVLEDPDGRRSVLVTLDLCGIDRPFSAAVCEAIGRRHRIPRERIVLACSHTHSGPVIGTNLITMYPMDDAEKGKVAEYTEALDDLILDAVGRAVTSLDAATLSWESGRADFAVNRRNNNQAQAAELREKVALQGPVDHDVPVLKVAGADGAPRAIICGYACHCTVLSGYQFSGDYAGFAQVALEADYPGSVALFVAGCGADQNPLPRGTVAHAERYGEQLADAVGRVLSGPLRPVSGPMVAAYEEIALPFAEIPARGHWEEEAKSSTLPVANRAKMLLKRIDGEGKLASTYPYPVQVWRLGDLTWVFLGGEVVVDYSLRLKRNLGSSHTWVSGYCNDVMAYIPSLRVLKEGGYEGATAMIYYGQPAPWSEAVEEDIIAEVRKLVSAAGRP
jgi:neutral ceramidase